jgi:hypothetical protein
MVLQATAIRAFPSITQPRACQAGSPRMITVINEA